MLEVYLTREQERSALQQRTNLSAFQDSYAAMYSNPQLSSSTLHWKFQSSVSAVPAKDTGKNRASWTRKKKPKSLTSASSSISSPPPRQAGQSMSSRFKPVSSNVPRQPSRHSSDNASLLSEDAVMVSPGMASVSFSNEHIKIKRKAEAARSRHKNKPHPTQDLMYRDRAVDLSSNNAALIEADDLYLDAVDLDPEMAIGPEMLRIFSQSAFSHSKKENKEGRGVDEIRYDGRVTQDEKFVSVNFVRPIIEVDGRAVRGTGSTSSEGFATPSPTPPKHSAVIPIPGGLQRDDSIGPDVTCSFKTANESFICGTDEEGEGEEWGKEGVREANVEQITQVSPSSNRLTVRTRGGHGPLVEKTTRSTSTGVVVEQRQSYSDEDFVDSGDIDRLLEMVDTKKQTSTSNSAGVDNDRLTLSESSPPPPPVPRRHCIATTTTTTTQYSSVTAHTADDEEVPPIPPLRVHSAMQSPPGSTGNCRQYLPSPLTSPEGCSLPENCEKEKIEEEGEDDKSGPPLPPRLNSLEGSEEVLMSGRLYSPMQFPYLPKMTSSPDDTAETRPASNGVQSKETSVLQSSWIYNSFDEMEEGLGGEKPDKERGGGVMTGSDSKGTNRTLAEDGLNLSSASPTRLESNEGVNTASEGRTGLNGSPVVLKACHKNNSGTDDELDENTIAGGEGGNFRSDECVPSVLRFASRDDEKIPDELPTNIGRRTRGTITESGSSETVIAEDSVRNYEEIQDQLLANFGRRTSGTVAESESSETVIAEVGDYEEMQDELPTNIERRTREMVTESESSEADKEGGVLVDDTESKTSSMTVTLDLSHIARDDIMYMGSSGEYRMNNCSSSSVDVSRISQIPINVSGNESSEETGRDGMVTPVEITYNESMFNLVKEKQKVQERVGMVVAAVGGKERRLDVGEDYDDDFDDAGSNDSAEYSSFPDEDESVSGKYVGLSSHISSEVQKKSRTWLSHSMERPNVVRHVCCTWRRGRGRGACDDLLVVVDRYLKKEGRPWRSLVCMFSVTWTPTSFYWQTLVSTDPDTVMC